MLPTIQPTSSSTFQTLEQLQPGGIVHLPFFRQGHNLFDRDHFTYQLAHEYPIGDPIMGFPPKAYLENALLCTILHLEYSQFPISLFPCTGMHSAQSVLDLQRAGFTAIVVDTDRYSDPYRRQIIDLLNRYLDPTTSSDSILIYSLHR